MNRLCMEQFFIDEKFIWECVINHSKFRHFLFLNTISSNNTFRNKALKGKKNILSFKILLSYHYKIMFKKAETIDFISLK